MDGDSLNYDTPPANVLPADWDKYKQWQASQAKNTAPSLDNIQQQYADMLRSDYDDWKKRFQPYEKQYRQLVDDPDFHNQALGYVDNAANSAFNRANAYQAFQNRKYGVQLDGTEKAAVNRRLGNEKAALLAQGRTNMEQALDQRSLGMLGNLNNLYTQDRAQALGQMGYLSGLAANRNAQNQQMNAAARSQQMQTIGGALGTFGTYALMGTPVTGGIMAGLGILGSLF
jgi:hypothetical protein